MAPPPDRVAPESPPPDIAPDMAAPGKALRSPYRSRHWRSSGVKECSFCTNTVGGELLSYNCHIPELSCAGCTARATTRMPNSRAKAMFSKTQDSTFKAPQHHRHAAMLMSA